MNTTTSIKEYYTNLYKLYHNAINLINGINQSLSSQGETVSIPIINDDNDEISSIRLPSFLYLDSKVQELSSNINSLISLPKSGESWLTENDSRYKINIVKSNVAPPIPNISFDENYFASFKNNEFLNKFISPHTMLRVNINSANINYVNKFYVKQLSIKSKDLFDDIQSAGKLTYTEYKNLLYNYETADLLAADTYKESELYVDVPYIQSKYVSSFKIKDIVLRNNNLPNPYMSADGKLMYDVILDTISYKNRYNSSDIKTLSIGDYITLVNNYSVYEVVSIEDESINNEQQYKISLKEKIGHTYLQTYEENNNMEFTIYESTNSYKYIDIPLDDSEYIILFIAGIYNNVIGDFSNAIIINLNDVKVVNNDDFRSPFVINSKQLSYVEFYKQFCKNLNNVLSGISLVSNRYPSEYSKNELIQLQESPTIQNLINEQINSDTFIIDLINDHISLNTIQERINNYVALKSESKSAIESCQSEINEMTAALLQGTADSSVNIKAISDKKAELEKNYNEFFNYTNSINSYKRQISNLKNAKYRIRGILNTTELETYIKDTYNADIIGLDVEYKYKSITESDKVVEIDNITFSKWNKMTSINKDSYILFDDYDNIFINYNKLVEENDIKWNQIDIPISENEIVVFRIRYKYSIGYPFITLYSPWSDEISKEMDNSESFNILDTQINENDTDVVTSNILKQLMLSGYTEHFNDQVIFSNEQNNSFLHNASHIYSGFNDTNNNPLSLKDKIVSLENELEKYIEKFDNISLPSYSVSINYNNISQLLHNDSYTSIELPILIDDSRDSKEGNIDIIIKNTGSRIVKLFTLFKAEGNSTADITDTNYLKQKVNQFIYFRKNNPFSSKETNVIQLDANIIDSTLQNRSIKFSYNTNLFDTSILKTDTFDDNTNLAYRAMQSGDSIYLKLKYSYNISSADLSTIDNKKYYLLFDIKTDPLYNKTQHYGVAITFKKIEE